MVRCGAVRVGARVVGLDGVGCIRVRGEDNVGWGGVKRRSSVEVSRLGMSVGQCDEVGVGWSTVESGGDGLVASGGVGWGVGAGSRANLTSPGTESCSSSAAPS